MTGCGTSNIITPSEPVVNSFTASPLTITASESSTLTWSVSDATSVSINQGVGSSLALSSSASVSPTVTTTYTLTATNAAGTVTATVQVIVSTTTHTVTFDSQGGSAVSSQVVGNGELVTEPTDPTKTGYTFDGWYKESGCTNAWNFATDTVTADITLYAHWTTLPLYALGDTGPAGGLIFYVKGTGYSDGWMYLEAAPASTEWTDIEWGGYETLIGGTATAIGSGKSNTNIIVTWLDANTDDTYGDVTNRTNRAAYLCDNLSYGGYNDWFLPSKDELNLMYLNLKFYGIGNFADCTYWSSSEGLADFAWKQNFYNGNQYNYSKNYISRVRAVRAF